MPAGGRKFFTPEEATALLPVIRQRLLRLRRLYQKARQSYREMEQIKAVGYKPDGTLIMAYDYKLARQALRSAIEEANRLLAEIHGFGCLVKDVDLGLVDFPAQLDGKPVLLCWRLGEPRVAYYHGEHEGFRGRKPLPPRASFQHRPASRPRPAASAAEGAGRGGVQAPDMRTNRPAPADGCPDADDQGRDDGCGPDASRR